MARKRKRKKPPAKPVTKVVGDYRQIIFPDGSAQPLKEWTLRHQSRMRDGYGSHNNGRHKLG